MGNALYRKTQVTSATYFEDAYIYTRKMFSRNWSGAQWVKLVNGTFLATYCDTDHGRVYLSAFANELDVLTTDNFLGTAETLFNTYHAPSSRKSSLLMTSAGTLLLFVNDTYTPVYGTYGSKTLVFKSANGLGTDFTLLATLYDDEKTGTGIFNDSICSTFGIPFETAAGTLLITAPVIKASAYAGYWTITTDVFRSTNDGATWVQTNYMPRLEATYINVTVTFGKAGGGRILGVWAQGYSDWNSKIVFSDDDGLSWTACTNFNNSLEPTSYVKQIADGKDGYTYFMVYRPLSTIMTVYRRPSTAVFNQADPYSIGDGNTWPETIGSNLGINGAEYIFRASAGTMLVYAGSSLGAANQGIAYKMETLVTSIGNLRVN